MKILDNFKRKNKEGFNNEEIKIIFESLKNADEKIFYECLNGVTVVEIEGETLFYEIDVEKAIQCSLEKRNLKDNEWD